MFSTNVLNPYQAQCIDWLIYLYVFENVHHIISFNSNSWNQSKVQMISILVLFHMVCRTSLYTLIKQTYRDHNKEELRLLWTILML